jgi:hypothetical protein
VQTPGPKPISRIGSQLNSQLKSRQKEGKEEAVNLVKNTLTEFKVEAEVSEIMEKTGDIYSGYDLATCRDERAHHQLSNKIQHRQTKVRRP